MTFDEWADDITRRVNDELPGVYIKRKVDDLCRIILGSKECQIHATSDSFAHFVALRRGDSAALRSPRAIQVAIGAASGEDLALRIIGFLQP